MDIFSYFQRKGIDTVDKSFYRMIALWESWYKGRVRNFTFYKIYSGQGTSIRRQRKSWNGKETVRGHRRSSAE